MSALLDMLKITGTSLNNISFCKGYSTESLAENGQAWIPLQQRGGEGGLWQLNELWKSFSFGFQ